MKKLILFCEEQSTGEKLLKSIEKNTTTVISLGFNPLIIDTETGEVERLK